MTDAGTTALDEVADLITLRATGARSLIVGVNGIDGSGKSAFAGGLASRLEARRAPVVLIHGDDFHHPRRHRYRRGELSAEGYYHDSFDCGALVDGALAPAKGADRFPVRVMRQSFDLDADRPRAEIVDVDRGAILLVEGVFLYRPGVARFFDVKIWLDVRLRTSLARMIARDGADGGAYRERVLRKYYTGQRLYWREARPRAQADIIVDNTDWAAPVVTRRPNGGGDGQER